MIGFLCKGNHENWKSREKMKRGKDQKHQGRKQRHQDDKACGNLRTSEKREREEGRQERSYPHSQEDPTAPVKFSNRKHSADRYY